MVTSLPAPGTVVDAGDVLATVSGRPVFLLEGRQPAYRDLGPGMTGRDVAELERALRRARDSPGAVDGAYDDATERAVGALYRRHGFEPMVASASEVARTRPAEADLMPGAQAGDGVQLPADEVVFVPTAPLRVTERGVDLGDAPDGALLTATDSDVVVDGLVPVEQAGRVRAGAKVIIDEPALGIDTVGRVRRVASRPGTEGADGFHVFFEVAVERPPAALVGASVRLTIPIRSTRTSQLTVPVTCRLDGPGRGGPRAEVGAGRAGLRAGGDRVLRRRLRRRHALAGQPGGRGPGGGRLQGGPGGGGMSAMSPLVRLVDVSRDYGSVAPVRALRGVDLEVRAGELVSVSGASGSGKTTLLNIIGCLDRPTSGSYWLDGVDADSLSDRRRAGLRSRLLGFVFQSFHLLSYRTVLENVMLAEVYGRRSWAGRAERARSALAAVGIEDRADTVPTRLSGGQRQRVAIARAIVNQPRMLLCDEPTGNLDSVTANGILELLGGLHAAGLTVIVITHDPGVAGWSERRVRLVDGRIGGDR